MRSRNIKPGLFKNEVLGEADPIYSLLFAGLWTLADREGRLENRPKKIKAELFPYRFDFDVCTALAWLKHESFIFEYNADGVSCLQINNWLRHQSPHHKEVDSVLPESNAIPHIEVKQEVTHAQAKHEPSMDHEQSKRSASSPLVTDSLLLVKECANASFDKFWELYPRKLDKKKSKSAWNRLSATDQKAILEHLPLRLKDSSWSDPEFILYPTTFLNGRRWEDELRAPPKQTGTKHISELSHAI